MCLSACLFVCYVFVCLRCWFISLFVTHRQTSRLLNREIDRWKANSLHVSRYIYIYTHIDIDTDIDIYIYIYVCVYTHTHTYACVFCMLIFVRTYILHTSVYRYMGMYICRSKHLYIYSKYVTPDAALHFLELRPSESSPSALRQPGRVR